jgi:Tol biopolymer transport system component
MGKTSPERASSERPLEDRLDSWKEIATYLRRDVTTVQRWEKREGMPVSRHLHDSMGSVYAFRTELDAWMHHRNSGARQEVSVQESERCALPSSAPLAPTLRAASPSRARWRFVLLLAAVGIVVAAGVIWRLERTEYFWSNPLAGARFQPVTDFDGLEEAAAISRDGRLVAFLSDKEGRMDVWITQVGSGEFHNLTRGRIAGLTNSSIRTPGFSPDNALVTFWVRVPNSSNGESIGVWAIPTLGGEPRPYLDGVAEFDWSHDGSRLAYHTPGPGDPLFITNGEVVSTSPILSAPAGLHSHFPLWAPDETVLYFVRGSLPDKLDIWRIRSTGGVPERITTHNTHVSHPVFIDRRTLMYLASDSEGSGQSLYSIDTERHIPHRLTFGLDLYTSLASSADGHRLVATIATPKRTLWRLRLDDSATKVSNVAQISLTTTSGFSPRLGPGYLLYVFTNGTGESISKLRDGVSTELWRGEGAQVIGSPAISSDGRQIAFSVRLHGHSLLYAMDDDGKNARVLTGSLDLQGAPAWAPDGRSIITGANDHGVCHLFRVQLGNHSSTSFVREYSVDPTWSLDGQFLLYSGPDIGTMFSVKGVEADGAPYPLPDLTLSRGSRHLALIHGGRKLVLLRGDLQHKDLWLRDLDTGTERQLTELPSDFDIRDFDVSPDGHEIVLERVQDHSNVVLLDLLKR